MKTKTTFASSALAAAALLLALGGAAAQTPSAEPVRAQVATPLNAGIELLRAGKFTEALAKATEAEAVAERTPYESFLIDQLRASAAAGAGDHALALRAYEAMMASGRISGAEALRISEGLAGTSYRLKDWDRAVRWSERYFADGGSNPAVRRLLANAQLQRSDWPAAARELQALLRAETAGGRSPPEDLLRQLVAAQSRQGDAAAAVATLEQLLRHHPKPAYWRDRVAQLQTAPGFDNTLSIDAFRLLLAAGALEDSADFTGLAERALQAGLPGEAKQVLDAGFAAGKLGTGPDAAAHQALRTKLAREAADDLKQLDSATPPPANASASVLVGTGLANITAGRFDRGLPMLEKGVATAGLKAPEQARLRLAWAQVLAGRNDAARATLQPLTGLTGGAGGVGGVGDLARLWLIHLDRPAKP